MHAKIRTRYQKWLTADNGNDTSSLQPPEPLKISGSDVADNWRRFRDQWINCTCRRSRLTPLQRDRAVGWISFGQRWNTGTARRLFCRHYRSIFNHCDVIGLQSYRIHVKTQTKDYCAVQGHSMSPMSVPIESPYATFY